MNGHERRKQRIIDRIKQSTLALFLERGANQVSVDEIATKADVSKVTIYKYFRSKEELHREVVQLYAERIVAATEEVLDRPICFPEKLNTVLVSNLNAPNVADTQALFEVLNRDDQAGFKQRIREIMYRFYEQGKKEGYIEESVPFELLYLYQQVFRAGSKAMTEELKPVVADPKTLEQWVQLFYYGFIQKK